MLLKFFQRLPYGETPEFQMFTITHIIAALICVILIVLFIKVSPSIKKSKYERVIRYSIACYMLFTSATLIVYSFNNSLPWYLYLPEATCGWAIYVGSIALFTKNRTLFILSFFSGFGALSSIIGPNILEGPNRYNFYQFFLRHMLIIITGLYFIKVLDFKLYKKDVKVYILITLPVVIIGGIISYYIDDPRSNMFFMIKPGINGTPLTWIYDYSYMLYVIVWLCFATFLAYIYGLPFYTNKDRGNENDK